MTSGILRATFGRLSVTKSSLGRVTIGHIQILGTALWNGGSYRTGGKAGKNTVTNPLIKLVPIQDELRARRLREDREILDLILAMIRQINMSVGGCRRKANLDAADLEVFNRNYKSNKDSPVEANKALNAVELNINNDYLELAQTLREKGVGLTLPPLHPVAAKPKKKKKEAKILHTAASLEQAIEDGDVDYNTAKKMAETATGISTPEAEMWLMDNVEVEEANLTRRQQQQRNGWINRGVEADLISYAELNPEVFAEAENIHENEEDMNMLDSARQAVRRSRGEEKDVRQSLPAKLANPSTEQSLKDELVAEWGEGILDSNITIVPTYSKISEQDRQSASPKVQAYIVGKGNRSRITLIADRIPKGKGKNLVLHEKGVHELLSEHKRWKEVLGSIENILANPAHPDFNFVTKAREAAITASHGDPNYPLKEETVAYLMNYGSMKMGMFKTIIRKMKQMVRDVLGFNMNTNDIIELTRAMVQDQLDTAKANKEEVANTPTTEMEVEEMAMTDEEMAMFNMSEETDERSARIARAKAKIIKAANTPAEVETLTEEIGASEDSELITDFYTAPATSWLKELDLAGGIKDKWHTAKVASLGFIPNRPLLDMLDRMLPDSDVKVSDVQDFYDRAEAGSDVRIEALDRDLIKPFQKYQRNNNDEYQDVVKMMLNATRINVDAEGSVAFDMLSPEGQKFYVQVREHYKMMREDKFNALQKYTSSLRINEKQRKEMHEIINELKREAEVEKVYFPFNRFGQYKVEGTDSKGERYVSHHDTYRAAKDAKRKRRGWDLKVTKVDNTAASAKDIFTPEAFDKANRFIEESGGNEEAQDMLWRTFLEYSPQRALQRKLARRRNVAGMSLDMIRGLGQSIHRDIRLNERMRVKPEVDNIFSDVAEIVEGIEGDNVKELEYLHELRQREVSDLRAPISKNITKFNFGYYLGFNPASAMVNLTQNAIVAMPTLSADYNPIKVITTMNKEFLHVVRNMGDVATLGYKGAELQAYKRMLADGTVNVTQAHMMTGINEGHTADYRPGGAYDKFVAGMAYMFHNAEIVNRATTAMTAYKLKMEESSDFNVSLKYAKDKTYESQFDFSETGKARYQRNDVGNVLLAMKSYPINMGVFMARNFNRWLLDSKATPEESKAARTKFLGTMIATTTIGGATALPLAEFLPEMFFALFGDDEDVPEEIIKEAVYSVAGEELGDILLKGLVGSVTGLDLKSKVSIGLDMTARVQGGQTADEFKESLVEGALGPVGGMVNNFTRGVDQMWEGKTANGLITMMPAALRNVSKSVKAYNQGAALTSYDTFIEEFDEKDAIFKALGFNSAEYAEYFQKAGNERRAENVQRATKSRLLRNYSWSKLQGTPSERRDARRAIREWNRTQPSDKQISSGTMSSSYKRLREKVSGSK